MLSLAKHSSMFFWPVIETFHKVVTDLDTNQTAMLGAICNLYLKNLSTISWFGEIITGLCTERDVHLIYFKMLPTLL